MVSQTVDHDLPGGHRDCKNCVKYSCIHVEFGKSIRFNIHVGSSGKFSCSQRNISRVFSLTVQGHFIAYCRRREVVKLFRFLLSPCSMIETCNHMQLHFSLTGRNKVGGGELLNLFINLGVAVSQSLKVSVVMHSRDGQTALLVCFKRNHVTHKNNVNLSINPPVQFHLYPPMFKFV
jgi:hypothetical protein